MKRIMILLAGMVAVMILGVVPVFGSQTIGTPLYTDPDVDGRIRGARLPRGYRFGRALPPSIDLVVEWQPIGDPDFYRGITGIFVDPDGIRVVDINPYAMAGMRVWLSRDGGKNWEVERTSPGVFRIVHGGWRRRRETFEGQFIGVEELALCRERAKVILSPSLDGSTPFRIWPLEVETLIKTEFRGLYEQRAHMSSAREFFLAQCPNNPARLAFAAGKAGPPHSHVRIFITLDGGQEWLEINSPWSTVRGGNKRTPILLYFQAIAIKSIGDSIVLYTGQMGDGKSMVQRATIRLVEIGLPAEK